MRAEITDAAKAAVEPKQTAPLAGIAGMMLELRKLAGMNQGEVGEILGLGRTSVTNIEKGNQPATIEHLEQLAAHLGLEVVVTVREKAHND
jgi:transcriptional regulator with XRE-family HTH domain